MNKMIQLASRVMTVAAATLLVAAGASATVLTSKLSVDNGYAIYVSTSNTAPGTMFGNANDWGTTDVNTTSLAANTDYYLHVYAYDQGGIAGLLGEFSLAGPGHVFANGLATMTSNTINWTGNNSGFSSAYGAVISLGQDGIGPWGNRPNIADSATWMWAGNANYNDIAYFSTKVSATGIPEPTSVALLGLGLLGLAASRRKLAKGKRA